MDVSLALQYLIVAAAVLLSLVFVVRRQFPQLVRRLRIASAVPLLREGKPAWQQWMGRRIVPPARTTKPCGDCDGCGDRKIR